MKKLLTVLLVIAMMLSFAGAAFAADLFSDTADQSAAGKTSIAKLNALEIIEGYPDGTFKPGNDITRAEFAKIACIAAGLKDSGEVLKNTPSKFSDVKPGNWFTGWVNLASAQGYVKGFPDGTFKPNNKITNAEVVTVLLRVLGYDDNLPGPWPVDYIAKASSIGVTDDVTFDAAANATRGNVSIMTANSLEQDIVYWDTDKARFLDAYAAPKTLMAENFKGAVYEGYVGAGWGMNTDADQYTITVSAGDDVTTAAVETAWAGTFTLAENFVISSGLVTGLAGHQFDIIYDSKDDEVKFIDVISTAKNSDDVVADGTKIKVDGVKYSKVAGVTIPASADSWWKVYFNDDGEIYRIDNKSGSALGGLVEKFNTTTEKIEYHETGALGANASVDYTDKTVVVEKGGKLISLSDIKEFDYVTVTTTITNVDYYLFVKPMVTGQVVAEYAGPKIKIGDKKYAYHASGRITKDAADTFSTLAVGSFDDTYGETVSYVLTGSNKIAYAVADVDAENESTIYGVITKFVNVNNITKEILQLTILNHKGEEVTYTVDTDEVIMEMSGAGNAYTGTETLDATVSVRGDLKFRVDANGKIDKLYASPYTADGNGVLASEIDDDNSRIVLNGAAYFVDSKTVIFNVAAGIDPEISTVAQLLDAAGLASAVDFELDGNRVKYMIVRDALAASADFALVDALYTTDKPYVELVGVGKYEIQAANIGAFGAVATDLIDYSISSGNKVTVNGVVYNASTGFGAALSGGTAVVAGNVDSVDTDTNSIKINGAWYVLDTDTVLFDYSDADEPEATVLANITQGETVSIYTSNDATKAGRATIVWVLIVQ